MSDEVKEVLHVYDGDGGVIIRENGNISTFGCQSSAVDRAFSAISDRIGHGSVTVKPLKWEHNGNEYYAYCRVTDCRWAALNTEARDKVEADRRDLILSALEIEEPNA